MMAPEVNFALLALYFEVSCQAPVFLKVFPDQSSQLLRCSADRLLRYLQKLFAHGRVDERLCHFRVQAPNDGCWRTARDKGALPGRKHESFDTGFLERWNVRQGG